MTVFRVERNRGYTVMSNHHLRNLSLIHISQGAFVVIPEISLCDISYIIKKQYDPQGLAS